MGERTATCVFVYAVAGGGEPERIRFVRGEFRAAVHPAKRLLESFGRSSQSLPLLGSCEYSVPETPDASDGRIPQRISVCRGRCDAELCRRAEQRRDPLPEFLLAGFAADARFQSSLEVHGPFVGHRLQSNQPFQRSRDPLQYRRPSIRRLLRQLSPPLSIRFRGPLLGENL